MLTALTIVGLLITATVGIGAYGMFWPRSRLFAPLIWRGARSDPPRVALSFDDGPHPETTPLLLDLLGELEVQATFFVIGANAERQGELIKRMDKEGHIVAGHSFHHDRLGMFYLRRYWEREIEQTNQLIESYISKRPAFFRPPVGLKNRHMSAALRAKGQQMVTWTRRGFDGVKGDPQRVVDRLKDAQAGDILVLHDGHEPNHPRETGSVCQIVRSLVELLRQRGFEFVRLDQLIGVEPYQETANQSK